MRVIKPITIDDSNLISSTIPEPDTANGEIEYIAGVYSTGDKRILTSTHRVYEVVAVPSTDDDPLTGIAADPQTWVDVSATNKWSMFDNSNGTTSDGGALLDVVISPASLVNSIAGFGVSGTESITVTVSNGTVDVYSRDIPMRDNSDRTNWYQFFFSPVVAIDRFVITDLPPVINNEITISASGNDVSIGNLIAGSYLDLGETVYPVSWQGLDFSIRESDGFGGFEVTRRRTADLLTYGCVISASKFSYTKNLLKSLSQVETVWIGNHDDVNDGTAVFGYYNDNKINMTTPVIGNMTIQIQELV